MLHSGIYQRGLRDWYSTNLANQQGIQTSYQNTAAGADISSSQAAGSLAQQLAQIQSEEQARRADLASQIRGVM